MSGTAISKSDAIAPRPSHTGRQAETNGTTASINRIGANGSSMEVTMWTARNASARSETLRCTASNTNRGTRSVCTRRTLATPIATLIVSRTSATAPVPRGRYQSALGPDTACHLRTPRIPPRRARGSLAREPAPAMQDRRRRSRALAPAGFRCSRSRLRRGPSRCARETCAPQPETGSPRPPPRQRPANG